MSEHALLELASRRRGLIEWAEARSYVSEKWLRHAVASQRLSRVHPAVYRFTAAPVTREQLLLAPCMAAGPDSAVSHRAASHEWSLGEFPDVIEIVTPRAQWPRMRGVFVRLEQPVDFDSVDDQPVDLIFALFAPKESAGVEHLRALARVSRLLRQPELRQQLRQARTGDAIHALLVQDPITRSSAA